MGIVRYSRPVSVDAAPTTVPLRQATLAWPGTEETCPKCQGQRHVYYLHADQPAIEVVGGKRVTCPTCTGTGTVRTPLRSPTAPG
jgi:DnaJ-class molecular chaperone